MRHLAVDIGVPEEADARQLSEQLVEQRIAAGTRTGAAGVPTHYRWEGAVHERTYYTVTALTTDEQLDRLYAFVETELDDDLPPITYEPFEASEEYLDWVESNTGAE
ncbi:MAG: divalent cation tolerance protein CutA [Halolamina sp.]